MKLIKEKKNQVRFIFLLILFVGIFIRLFHLGSVPQGLNQDEAFAGYEAFSMLKYGKDSAGYVNPCYLVAWGNGMNALESYLAIPFIALLGNTVLAIRLPQAIFACLSLPVFYLLLKKIFSAKTALLGLGLLAISPWHILLSRWGLESNLAPAFLLFGFYFFIKGLDKNSWFIASAIAYGLSLYAYAITWLVVPLTLFGFVIYMLYTKIKVSMKYSIIAIVLLFLLALPLMLFLLVNNNIIPEIRTSFISIPKMPMIRSGEISWRNIFSAESLQYFSNTVFSQKDDFLSNVMPEYKMFYTISLPFIALGLVRLVMLVKNSFQKHTFSKTVFVGIGMLVSLVCCLFIAQLNINKANSLHFYTLILLTLGVREIYVIFKQHLIVFYATIVCFVFSFASFSVSYFSTYNTQISPGFRYGVEESVDFVNKSGFTTVAVSSDIYYPQILYFDETSYDEYNTTVNREFNGAHVNGFSKYTFGIDENNLNSYDAFIINKSYTDFFEEKGYTIFGAADYCVAYK